LATNNELVSGISVLVSPMPVLSVRRVSSNSSGACARSFMNVAKNTPEHEHVAEQEDPGARFARDFAIAEVGRP
jgi:hypothetical protein